MTNIHSFWLIVLFHDAKQTSRKRHQPSIAPPFSFGFLSHCTGIADYSQTFAYIYRTVHRKVLIAAMGASFSSAGCTSAFAKQRTKKRKKMKVITSSSQAGNLAACVLGSTRSSSHAIVPSGKLTNFGYSTDFEDKYELGKKIGSGQFGKTFVATQIQTGEEVAVKVIDKSKMLVSNAVEDVKREVKILQALSGDENVVQLHKVFEDDDCVYIVMELCKGGELLDRILSRKNNRYTEKDAAKVVRQMLKAVACCHLHGIVHRDLKPENFLFQCDHEGSVLKMIDFGLSDYIRPGKFFRNVVGSLYYVAPEVLRQRSGPESDIWSIGVITYILLSGRRPFYEKTEDGIYHEVLNKRPDLKEKPWPSISPSAKDLVAKLLNKNPRARLTAAQALSHPWIRGEEAPDIPLDICVLSNMREFVTYSHLRKIALRALVSILTTDQTVNLRDQFNVIDTDKNGTISLEEIQQALAKDKPWSLQESKVQEILHAMDTNMDGLVDFDDFAAAALHVHQLEDFDRRQWQKQCRAAFEKLDADKDGYITPEELKLYTGINASIDSIIDEADIDKDGRISLQEFQCLLQASLHV